MDLMSATWSCILMAAGMGANMLRVLMVIVSVALGGGVASAQEAPLETLIEVPGSAQPLSAEELLRAPEIRAIEMSPSGRRLAVIYGADDERSHTVAMYNVDGDVTISGGINLGDAWPMWLEWATEDRLLIGIYRSYELRGRRYYYPTARTIAIDADGGNSVVLFADERSVLRNNSGLTNVSLLPDDPDHVLMPAYRGRRLRLWRVNINTGEAEEIISGGASTWFWVTDRAGIPVLRIDINRRWVSIFAPDPERSEGRWTKINSIRIRRDGEPWEFQPLGYTDQPGVLYVAGRPDGVDATGIYLYDIDERAYLEEVATHPGVDVNSMLVSPKTGLVFGYEYADDRYRTQFFDEDMRAHWDGVCAYMGEDVEVLIADISDDGRRWLIYVTGPQLPGDYYVYDMDERHVRVVASQRADLLSRGLSPVSVVRYSARDGTEIFGYLTTPRHAGGAAPLIVMPHGGPAARDEYGFDVYTQFLASRGYAVFQPQFRGSAGFGQAFEERGHMQWGRLMQDDISDGVAYLIETHQARAGAICIVGSSYGGYAALAGATLTPDLYRCAISISGITDLQRYLRYKNSDRNAPDEEYDYWAQIIGDRREDADIIAAVSPIELVDRVQIPILLMHGTEDDNVPFRQSRDMHRALEAAGKDVRFVEIEGAGHSYWDEDDETLALEEIATFLAEHLPVN